jgi:hypothetical protein
MAALQIHDLDHAFDDHASLSASLEDFEENQNRSPLLDLPSHHSGFRSEPADDSDREARSSNGDPWSPPGFDPRYRPDARADSRSRSIGRGAAPWLRHDPYRSETANRLLLKPSMSPSASGSRQTSPEYEDARDQRDGELDNDDDDDDDDDNEPTSATIPAAIGASPAGDGSPVKGHSPEPAFAEDEEKTVTMNNCRCFCSTAPQSRLIALTIAP